MTSTHTLPLRWRSIVSRLTLSVMVCTLLLQTPLPVLHQHSEFAWGGELTLHLDRYHGGLSAHADEVHWHFMLPNQRGSHDGQPEQSPPLDAWPCCLASTGAVATTAALESIDLEHSYGNHVSAWFAEANQVRLCRIDSHPPQSSLRPAVRLCALLCVIRC